MVFLAGLTYFHRLLGMEFDYKDHRVFKETFINISSRILIFACYASDSLAIVFR